MDALTWLEILKRYGFSTFVAIVLLLVILGLVPSSITHEADVQCAPSAGSLAVAGTGSDVISWAQT